MEDKFFDEMFKEFFFNEECEETITSINGMTLPDDYLRFMDEFNGGEGPLGKNNYGCLYPLDELDDVNYEYEVQNNWPGCVVIGSDMGGQLWACNPDKGIYCQIDSCNTGEDTYHTVSDSFEEFLIKMDEELEE